MNFLAFILRSYHNSCYAQREKTALGTFFVGSKPINTKVSTYTTAIATILFFIVAGFFAVSGNQFGLIAGFGIVILIIIFVLYPRLSSYYKYEKVLARRR